MTPHPDSRLSPTALLSLAVGMFSALCFVFFPGISGITAIALGFVALSEIKRSEGRLHGMGAAIVGITLGFLHVGGAVVMLVLFVTSAASAKGPLATPAPVTLPTPSPIPTAPGVTKLVNPEQPGGRTHEAKTRIAKFGGVTLVDPAPGATTLDALLRDEQTRAGEAREKLLVWISSPEVAPCSGVSVALRDPRLQKALAGVRIVRLNVNDYYVELSRRGLPVKVLPGFVLLDPEGRPLDYVNGGEWDADVPENIAPVLGNFIHGRYTNRRNPWLGPSRGDETAL